jgi:DNA repair exonuclease SbcCD ATPase subunit
MNVAKKSGGQDGGALSKIKKLQEQMEEYSKEAVAEALEQAEDAIATLSSLGQRYRLVRVSARGKGMRQTNPDRPCPVCQFKTEPPHDARQHRGQGKSKRAFTSAQLAEMGLRKA